MNKLSHDDGSRKFITLGEYLKRRKAKTKILVENAMVDRGRINQLEVDLEQLKKRLN